MDVVFEGVDVLNRKFCMKTYEYSGTGNWPSGDTN
jgi:hypothetical protein